MENTIKKVTEYFESHFPESRVLYHHIGGTGLHVFRIMTPHYEHTVQFSDEAFDDHSAEAVTDKLKTYCTVESLKNAEFAQVILFRTGEF